MNKHALISADAIDVRIKDVAHMLNAHYAGEELTLVMVMKGALFLVADLMRHLHMPCVLEFVTAKSYGQRGTERGELHLSGIEEINVSGKNVLIVDDIFDSGATLFAILTALKKKNPKQIQSLVLLSKKVEREIRYTPDYVLFDIENAFVIGYGLDFKEHYRNLPGIYILEA